MIDLIFTFEAILKRNVKTRVFKDIVKIIQIREKVLITKGALNDLYKEMQLRYLETMKEFDKLEEEYSCFEEGDLLDDSDDEKMKFKYVKKSLIKKTRESENWWNEYDIITPKQII